jgi:hypothetical protein
MRVASVGTRAVSRDKTSDKCSGEDKGGNEFKEAEVDAILAAMKGLNWYEESCLKTVEQAATRSTRILGYGFSVDHPNESKFGADYYFLLKVMLSVREVEKKLIFWGGADYYFLLSR